MSSPAKTKKIENRSGKIIAGDHDNADVPAATLRIDADELLNTKDAFAVSKFTATRSGGTGQGVSDRWQELHDIARRESYITPGDHGTDKEVYFEYDEVTTDSEFSDALATGDIILNVGQVTKQPKSDLGR